MSDSNGNKKGDCDKIYRVGKSNTNEKKIIWLLGPNNCFWSLYFCLRYILTIFGFLFFKDSNGKSGAVSIK